MANSSITLSAFKGFILEEVLSKLLENSGYSLIDKNVLIDNKHPEFISRGNGLNIKGRGGIHQADVLGQFPFSFPFNYPIRLFIEAKYRTKKTGIDVVRSAIGILTDLNSNYQTIDLNNEHLLVQRFNYNYAIFSTSGFSENAIKLAIAYKITLIDLGGSEYESLLNVINEVASELHYYIDKEEIELVEIRHQIRARLFNNKERKKMQTQSLDETNYAIKKLVHAINEYEDLYLASVNSPFSILIKPDFPKKFKDHIKNNEKSTFEVSINWKIENPNTWHIYNVDSREKELNFTFYLPKLIKNYVFNNKSSNDIVANALNAKGQFFERIVFYVKSSEKFIIFKYKPTDTP